MKLTSLLMLCLSLQLSARVRSQTITYTGRDVRLTDVFRVIKQQTGYVVFYDQAWVAEAPPLTVNARNQPLERFLQEVLTGLPLAFSLEDKAIVITRKNDRAVCKCGSDSAANDPPPTTVPVTGRVGTPNGDPLAGANIVAKRTGVGTATDATGVFHMEVDPSDVLIVSYTGYQSAEVRIGKQRMLMITLKLANNKLDEVQIVAYGQSSPRYNVGNVTTVKSEDIAKAPVSNILQALQGRVPGLYIEQQSGFAGGAFKINIEGQNSLSKGNYPFFVIDGVPYIDELVYDGTNRWLGNPLNFINPADVESVTVLKDADATAIYGSRAANGAILINTKRGKPGRSAVEINVRTGDNLAPRRVNVLNRQQYMEMRHEAKRNDGTPISSTDYDLNGLWDTTRNTDWQRALTGNPAHWTEANASISGGSGNARYLLGLTYNQQTPPVAAHFLDQKASAHFALTTASTNQRFKADWSTSYVYDNNQMPQNDNSGLAPIYAPVAPPLYHEDGSVNWAENASGNPTWNNPVAGYKATNNMLARHFSSSLRLGYEILRGLELSSRLGFDDLQTEGVQLTPLTILPPSYWPYNVRYADFRSTHYSGYNIEPQLNFNRTFGVGKLEVTTGFTIQEKNTRGRAFEGTGFTSDAAMKDLTFAKSVTAMGTSVSRYRSNGGFGRISYIHDKKYILSLTGRRDGTSRFGADNLFHNFGAIGVGWIFTEEPWLRKHNKVLSFGKINASYGTTGNDQIGDYQYMDLFYAYNTSRPYQNSISLRPNQLSNPDLQWELTTKFNAGIQLGFFNDRLMLDADYYRNQSGNQLLQQLLPGTTGFSNTWINRPATVRNVGLHFTITSTNIRTNSFSWTTRFNWTYAANKLVRYDGLADSWDASSLVIGKSLNGVRLFPYAGVDPTTGLYTFHTHDGKITSAPDYNKDRTLYVDEMMHHQGGLDNTLTWKGFELSVIMAFVIHNGQNYNNGYVRPALMYNQPTTILDRWQKPGDHARVQRFSISNTAAATAYDAWRSSNDSYRDASFMRVKNLSLSWHLPTTWAQSIHAQQITLYGNAQNVLTWTHYALGDPETASLDFLPGLRTITLGIKADL